MNNYCVTDLKFSLSVLSPDILLGMSKIIFYKWAVRSHSDFHVVKYFGGEWAGIKLPAVMF